MRQVPRASKMNILDFKRKKYENAKICMITCYDYACARIVAESTVDCVLVGDSVAMAVHGYENTLMATMDMMQLHTHSVARGLTSQYLIADMPFMSYRISHADTMRNARSLLQAGAQAIKMEGADLRICEAISRLVDAGVPVMGHIGLTPQSVHQLGGHRVQGKQEEQKKALMEEAKRLEAAGCFAVVIECVPHALATAITALLSIPTIGIGAGAGTDGQVLVWHDLLGLQMDFSPKFLKRFVDGKALLLQAIDAYAKEVHTMEFPTLEHMF